MSEEMVKTLLIAIFEEEGIYIDSNEEADINISNYIKDSLQFISIIVAIEEKFGVEISDGIMVLEAFESFHRLIDTIYEMLKLKESETQL